ncbi:hypothetical protein D910_10960 [Dendroctonus ponderosae]|uniref:DDE Tnp4 domain-containing protein n=1 Tax=Dendroctonus ponderosae TaxID=77166 RepID=U4UKM9_DENPD|nr:hypothetical protein D910_10960 [Dendroctonus ponderosae]
MYYSIDLMAVVDVNYKVTMIDVGSFGKNSDGSILEHSYFGKLLYGNTMDLPENKELNGSENHAMPVVFVGDEAFRLSQHLMKPYPRRNLDLRKKIFNYRLSHARQLVECAFGILVSKFRIFETSIAIKPTKIDKTIKAACVLHNFIRIEENGTLQTQLAENVRPDAFLPMENAY